MSSTIKRWKHAVLWHRVDTAVEPPETVCLTGWHPNEFDSLEPDDELPPNRNQRCPGCYAREELAEASLAEYADTIRAMNEMDGRRTRLFEAIREVYTERYAPLSHFLTVHMMKRAVQVEEAAARLYGSVQAYYDHQGPEAIDILGRAIQGWHDVTHYGGTKG